VVGTGVGMDKTGQIVVKIFSNQMPAATRSAIQQRFSDIPIAIEETGEIRKQAGKPA